MSADPDARIRQYFRSNADVLRCCICGRRGVRFFPNGPNDNLNKEHGGWCSPECFEAEVQGEGTSC